MYTYTLTHNTGATPSALRHRQRRWGGGDGGGLVAAVHTRLGIQNIYFGCEKIGIVLGYIPVDDGIPAGVRDGAN